MADEQKKSFASVGPDIVDAFISGVEDLRAGLVNIDSPHYDDKALTLFLLLRFHANCSLEFYTNENMLCELMGLSQRQENKKSIMSNILQMRDDGFLHLREKPGNKFFYIVLDYDTFVIDKGFVRIYKEEFEQLLLEKNKDKLILTLYAIKRFQHNKTEISFPSIETLMNTARISKPTLSQCLDKIAPLFYIYKARIHFHNGTYKDVNYYKSRSEKNDIDPNTVDAIVKKHYANVKSISQRNRTDSDDEI